MFRSLFETKGLVDCTPVKLLRWDLLTYVHYKIVRFVAGGHFIPSVCVSSVPY